MKCLYKIKITPTGKNSFVLECSPYKNGGTDSRRIVFKGTPEKLRRLLIKMKAADTKSSPASVRNLPYNLMLKNIISGVDREVFAYSNMIPKVKVIAEKTKTFFETTLSARDYINRLQENLSDYDKSKVIDYEKDILDLKQREIDTDDKDEKKEIQDKINDIEDDIREIKKDKFSKTQGDK